MCSFRPRRKRREEGGPVALAVGGRKAKRSVGGPWHAQPGLWPVCLLSVVDLTSPAAHVHPFGGLCPSVFVAIFTPSVPGAAGQHVWR